MAWQSPSAMAGSGGGLPGVPGEGGGGHPQGTEYTLQGEATSSPNHVGIVF
jgi:hypothetical protein